MPGMFEALESALKGDVPAETQGTAATETPPVAVEAKVEAQATATTDATPADTEARARDESGRFAKQEAKPATAQAAPIAKPATLPVQQPTQTQPIQGQPASAQEQPQAGSAPRSWSPAVREHWGVLPRPVKDEILKREGEVSRAIGEAAQAKSFQRDFEAVAAPYRALFTAPPIQVAANLFQTAAALQTGPVSTKAALIARMISDFGVPPDAVADALEGKQGGQQPQAQGQQYRDPRVDDLLRRQQMAEQQTQQVQLADAQRQLAEFERTAEFLDDVREDMVVLLQTGRAASYSDAYRKACAMNESVATVMAQRKADEARRTQSQQVQQARQAAGSVKSDPAPPPGSRKPTLDEALAAAISGSR